MKKFLLFFALTALGMGGFLKIQAQTADNSQQAVSSSAISSTENNNFTANFSYIEEICPEFLATDIIKEDIGRNCVFETGLNLTATGEGIKESREVEVMLVMDRSGSMASGARGNSKIDKAKDSLYKFIDLLDERENPENKTGLVTFSHNVSLDSGLTSNYDLVREAIDRMRAVGNTDIGDALILANNQLKNSSDKEKFIILASDGRHNTGTSPRVAARRVYSNVTVHTVGIGSNNSHFGGVYPLNESTLKYIAHNSGTGKGNYYYSDTTNLEEVYSEIFEDIFRPFEAENVELEFYLTDEALEKAERKEINPPEDSLTDGVISWEIDEIMKNEDSKNFQMKFRQNDSGKYFFNKAFVKVGYKSFGKEYKEILSIDQLRINSGNCTGSKPDENAIICDDNLIPPHDMPKKLVSDCNDYSGSDKACKYKCRAPYEYHNGGCVTHGACPPDLPTYTCDFSYTPRCSIGNPNPSSEASIDSDTGEFYWSCLGAEGGNDAECRVEKRTCTSNWIEVAF